MTTERQLPAEFADLEPLARVWAIPDRNERYQRRLASSMEDLRAFYDAMMPRGEEILTYLDRFPLDDLPDEALHLMWLLASLSVVSFSVEIYRQPRDPDGGATSIDWVSVPTP